MTLRPRTPAMPSYALEAAEKNWRSSALPRTGRRAASQVVAKEASVTLLRLRFLFTRDTGCFSVIVSFGRRHHRWKGAEARKGVDMCSGA
ncbi:unnamed protein product [Urochloa humidicola]